MATTTLFIASFQDGYQRRLCSTSLNKATKFAKDLEAWFAAGEYNNRILIDVQPAR